ncbi:hypothetical protein EGW08_015031, partial [Elysia chlorotica]
LTRVGNRQSAASEVLSAGSTELNVVTVVVVHSGLSQHGVVLNLRFPVEGSVVGNDDQLSHTSPECLQRLFVAKHILAGLHHKRQTGIDVVRCLF